MKIGIFYGSTTGVTEAVAERIAKKLGVASADVHNVGSATAVDAVDYDALLLGTSTWGAGELQDDWYDFLDQLKSQDLTGKKVALFGCGDSSSFSDTFCSAMGEIHDGLAATGCTFVGQVDASGYTYDDSAAESGGKFVGLALDEVNEDDKTDGRIDAWAAQLKNEGVE